MKTVLHKLGISEEASFEQVKQTTALLMILFFITFGALSLYVLLNSAA